MGNIRVLVVDDSELARSLIITILSSDSEIEVAGEARNGQEAIRLVQALKPSLVTIDVEMPVMGGLEAIEEIMATNAVPILVVTTRGDSATAHRAISRGALDLVAKPDISLCGANEFIAKVKMLSRIKVVRHIGRSLTRRADSSPAIPNPALSFPSPAPALPVSMERPSEPVVAIASSAGGPLALSVLLGAIPASFAAAIVIAQHHSEGFVPGMVEWFRRICKVPVKVAEDGELVMPGMVYVSPSERHMQITPSRRVALLAQEPSEIFHPSCDTLLSSVARTYGPRAIGVILTGMGTDGTKGMRDIKAAGGKTIAQDEETCTVFGMPGSAIGAGCIDRILPLERIAPEIANLMARASTRGREG